MFKDSNLLVMLSQEMLSSTRTECRARAFDLILNLGVHAHLLEPVLTDIPSTIEEEYCQETSLDGETQVGIHGLAKSSFKRMESSTAIDDLESWILNILYEILLFLVQVNYD